MHGQQQAPRLLNMLQHMPGTDEVGRGVACKFVVASLDESDVWSAGLANQAGIEPHSTVAPLQTNAAQELAVPAPYFDDVLAPETVLLNKAAGQRVGVLAK